MAHSPADAKRPNGGLRLPKAIRRYSGGFFMSNQARLARYRGSFFQAGQGGCNIPSSSRGIM